VMASALSYRPWGQIGDDEKARDARHESGDMRQSLASCVSCLYYARDM
jgi:hypothetical protein